MTATVDGREAGTRDHHGRVLALALVFALAGCAPTPGRTETAVSVQPSVSVGASASPSAPPAAFPTAVFADLGEEPVSDELAAELQEVLDTTANGDGVTATLITSEGTWSGATGFAAGDRAMSPGDQMSIASITKTFVAAQVMQLAEAGELRLDDPAALPPGLEFDTNGATIADLLSHRSGFPETLEGPGQWESFTTDPLHAWTTDEVLGPSDLNATRSVRRSSTGEPITCCSA